MNERIFGRLLNSNKDSGGDDEVVNKLDLAAGVKKAVQNKITDPTR